MARAHFTTKTGTKITLEGSPAEVASLVGQIEAGAIPRKGTRSSNAAKRKEVNRAKATPMNLASTLIDGGFFSKPKDLAAVKVAFEEMGHYFPVTTLSPTLLRLVRSHQLRRLRDRKGKKWLYTG